MGNYLIFFAGVLTSTLLFVIIKQYSKRSRANRLVIRQSDVLLMAKSLFPESFSSQNYYSQALSYENNKSFKYIEMPDNRVYWLNKNNIYYADIKGGRFNPEEGKLTEMKNLSEKQVNKVLFIYNSLKNG